MVNVTRSHLSKDSWRAGPSSSSCISTWGSKQGCCWPTVKLPSLHGKTQILAGCLEFKCLCFKPRLPSERFQREKKKARSASKTLIYPSMASFLQCLESEKGREEVWPGSTRSLLAALFALGVLRGAKGLQRKQQTVPAGKGSWQHRVRRRERTDSLAVTQLQHCVTASYSFLGSEVCVPGLPTSQTPLFWQGWVKEMKRWSQEAPSTPLQDSMWVVFMKMGSFILHVKQGKKLSDFQLALSENLFQNLGHWGF